MGQVGWLDPCRFWGCCFPGGCHGFDASLYASLARSAVGWAHHQHAAELTPQVVTFLERDRILAVIAGAGIATLLRRRPDAPTLGEAALVRKLLGLEIRTKDALLAALTDFARPANQRQV